MAGARKPDERYSERPLPAQPRIGVQAIHPLMACLREASVDLSAFFDDVGLTLAALEHPDARLPLEKLDPIWEHAAKRMGDGCFGLHAAWTVRSESFGILSYLGVTSATLGDGIGRVCRYFRILSDASGYELRESDGMATLTARHDVPRLGPVRHRVEFTVGVFFRYLEESVATPWTPLEVFFEHREPPRIDEHRRLFRCPLRFDAGASGFTFPASLLDSPLEKGDPHLAAILERFARQMLSEVVSPTPVAQALREQLFAAGPGADLSVAAAARRLGMSVRTLQRRLHEENTSHQTVVDGVRHAVAKRMLAQARRGVAEVAFALGFSEPAAFHRAFKRWTGQTPIEYRRAVDGQLER